MNKGTIGSCKCSVCVGACEKNPGWMSPPEAMRAIAAGYGGQLMVDWWEPSANYGNDERIYLLCPASAGHQADMAPEMSFFDFSFTKGRCTFLEDGLCAIHDSGFKPMQCRTMIHDEEQSGYASNMEMIRLWDNAEAQRLVVAYAEFYVGREL